MPLFSPTPLEGAGGYRSVLPRRRRIARGINPFHFRRPQRRRRRREPTHAARSRSSVAVLTLGMKKGGPLRDARATARRLMIAHGDSIEEAARDEFAQAVTHSAFNSI